MNKYMRLKRRKKHIYFGKKNMSFIELLKLSLKEFEAFPLEEEFLYKIDKEAFSHLKFPGGEFLYEKKD